MKAKSCLYLYEVHKYLYLPKPKSELVVSFMLHQSNQADLEAFLFLLKVRADRESRHSKADALENSRIATTSCPDVVVKNVKEGSDLYGWVVDYILSVPGFL
jgi:hypothetical protein